MKLTDEQVIEYMYQNGHFSLPVADYITKRLKEIEQLQTMVTKQVSIDPQKPSYKTELYCNWYKCPQCNTPHIAEHFKYCPNCGALILWQPPLNIYIVAGIQVRKNDTVAYFGPETYRASSKNDLVAQLKKNYPGLLRDLKIIEIKRRLPQQE